jgi:hypothetical protein
MENPKLLFGFSWPDTKSDGSSITRRYSAPLGELFKDSGRSHDAEGLQINTEAGRMELLVGNKPSSSGNVESIILQPGEQRLFGPKDKVHLGDVTSGREALFLEPGWNTSGGIALYRTLDSIRRSTYSSSYEGTADESGNEPWDRDTDLNAINAEFGRLFQIVKMRFLNKEDV